MQKTYKNKYLQSGYMNFLSVCSNGNERNGT